MIYNKKIIIFVAFIIYFIIFLKITINRIICDLILMIKIIKLFSLLIA